MRIEITGRHMDVTPALREFAEEKLRKLERLLDEPIEIHVVLGIEKHRHSAEILVRSRNVTLTGTEETGDLYASIGEVVDKVERQALKHKEKTHDHKHRRGLRDPDVAASLTAPGEAGGAATSSEADQGPTRIVRTASYRLKPLSAEDAALELETSGELLLVFREAASDRVCVIFRREDGDYGLVEPEF
jgi:putative sigma-54 modulation protein